MSVTALPRRDQAARDAIRDDLDVNLFVEAAAGTGKTRSLVDRMLALVERGRPVERICAVTFTLKAAAQLKERFQIGLEEARSRAKRDADRETFSRAVQGLDRCFIGTIHAFCARLLRERPVEAGVDPEFEELDETADALVRDEAWERYKQSLFVESRPILSQLAAYNIPIETLAEAYRCLAANPDVDPAVSERLPEPRFDRERERTLVLLEEARRLLPPRNPEAKPDELQKWLRGVLQLLRIVDVRKTADLVRVFDKLDFGPRSSLASDWSDPVGATNLAGELAVLRSEVVVPSLGRWREFLYPIVIEAVKPAVAEFRRLRRERGALDFGDLLLFARDLLRDHPEVRRDFQKRFTPILVDEFQDTDPVQAEILLFLTGHDFREKDWRKLEPVPGSLFVVGDPKQSIYRFRRADIETYEKVRERILASGGRVLELTTNFRSCPEIAEWVNSFFEGIFPAESTREQAGHVRLEPDRAPALGISGAYRLEAPARGRRYDDIARADAVRIAEWIRAALDSKIEIARAGSRAAEPGDFLILFRLKKRMDIYARELEARGVPYEIAGGGAFSESEDIRDLLAVLEAVVDPDDAVSLVASLRGIYFGVDDDALYRFRRSGARFHLFAPLPADADPRIVRAFGMLRDAHELVRTLPPAAALARIAERLGAIPIAGAQELGSTRAGNLLKAVAIARSLSGSGDTFGAIVRHLRALTVKSDTEEMSTRPGESRAVRLMTLHRAKGLEAPIVFLADPTGEREPPLAWCVDRESEPPRAWLRVFRKEGFNDEEVARPEGWAERENAEKAFQRAEKDRLLYVAATRAADVLVVSQGTTAAQSPWAKLARAATRTLPELSRRPAAVAEAPPPDLSAELAAFRDASASRREAAARDAYAVQQVTKLSHALGAVPFRTRTGRGMSWGRVIHRLLEAGMRDPALDLEQYAANVLTEEDRPATDLAEAVELARSVMASPLWKRALAARRQFVEIPFALEVDSAEIGAPDAPPRTVLQGAIDLAFEEDAGWVLVDYKSDTIAGNLDELVAFYRPQIELYRRYWERLTGRPTTAGLYFLSTGQAVWPPAS